MKKKVAVLAVGSVLSESSFFTVKELKSDHIIAVDDSGNEMKIGNPYVEKVLIAADYFEKEEKRTATQLAELFIGSSNIAISVGYYKKDTEKSKRAYDIEVQAAIAKVQNAKLSDAPKLLKELIENPISRAIS